MRKKVLPYLLINLLAVNESIDESKDLTIALRFNGSQTLGIPNLDEKRESYFGPLFAIFYIPTWLVVGSPLSGTGRLNENY